MSRKSIITALVISMFLVSVIPTANAYKGYQLSRGPVDDFTLTNQDNELMNLTDFVGMSLLLHLFSLNVQTYAQLSPNYCVRLMKD